MTYRLPLGWVETELEQIAEWGSGGTPSRKHPEYFCGDIPWIKTGELVSKYVRDSEEKISSEAIRKSSAKVFPAGSVGIAMYGATIGKLSIFAIDASTNQACAVAKSKTPVLYNEFLYYFLLSEKRALINSGKGGAQPNISQGLLKSWPIKLPPLNEQKRIVAKIEEFFSELDNGIAVLLTAREQLKVYRQAVLKHAFEGKLTAKWREENADKLESPEQLLARIQLECEARYQQQLEDWKAAVKEWEAAGKEGKKPGKPKKYKPNLLVEQADEPDTKIPTSWMQISFSELLFSIRGGTTVPPIDIPTTLPILRSSSIRAGHLNLKDIRFLPDSVELKDEDFLSTEDLLFSRLNGTLEFVGVCASVPHVIPEKLVYPDRLYRAKLVDPEMSKYCEYYFSNPVVRRKIEKKAKSTAGHKRISIPDISEQAIPLMDKREMIKIVEALSEKFSFLDAVQEEIKKSLLKSEALRQSILKKAFSGQLVVQDPDDEPASELLARIQAEKDADIAKQGAKSAKRKPNKKQTSKSTQKESV